MRITHPILLQMYVDKVKCTTANVVICFDIPSFYFHKLYC